VPYEPFSDGHEHEHNLGEETVYRNKASIEEVAAEVEGEPSRSLSKRWLIVVGIVVLLVLLVGIGAIFGIGGHKVKPSLKTIKLVHTTYVSTDVDGQVTLSPAATGTSSILKWTPVSTVGGKKVNKFIVQELTISSQRGPHVLHSWIATSSVSTLFLSKVPSTTTAACFAVTAVLGPETYSRRGFKCPPGMSLSLKSTTTTTSIPG
jgi:hypothetical protein